MENFKKTVRLGTIKIGKQPASVFCKIEFTDGRLSISGVEGPTASGNARGSFGQIEMHLVSSDISPAPGWSHAMIDRFLSVWRAWHLNDMRAGSPAQTVALKEMPKVSSDYYTVACAFLKARGLNPDPGYLHNGKPYVYGTAWLRVDVPEEVLAWLVALPDTDKIPAWV